MKVKAIRASGNPVDPEKADAHKAEWQEGFDAIVKEHGKVGEESSKRLEELEKSLNEKYNDLTVIDLELPTTGKAWKDMLSKYGNVMLTTCIEDNQHAKTGDLLFVINDMPF